MKVLLTGATGLVGREIGKFLAFNGHEIFVISRDANKAKLDCPFPCQIIVGSLDKDLVTDPRLKEIEGVIHLAGESVAEARWSEAKKKKIHDSRELGTKNLIASLKNAALKVFVSTSASGYYGDRGTEALDESAQPGNDFLAKVCVDWEAPVLEAKSQFTKCRFVIFRVGMVISPFGGAMLKMISPFRRGVGGAVGSGKQFISWIHISDLANAYVQAIENAEYSGTFNAVAPQAVTNHEFSKVLAKSLGSSLAVSIPTFAIKAMFGEMSHVLLSSQNLQNKKLKEVNFKYQYPSVSEALAHVGSYYQNDDEIYRTEQYLPAPRKNVFPFFSEAKNLEELTPPLLQFKVLKMSTAEIESGTLIDYRLKIHGVPVSWRTEILDWQPVSKFTDTQLKGPYSKWHHTHEFFDMGSGTLMTDLVRYKLPLGLAGWAVGGAFVAKDVKQIFAYRKKVCAAVDFNQRS